MGQRVFVGSFTTEEDVLGAVRAAREHGFRISDVYTPYAVHGLDRALGLRPSRLPWVCFGLGLLGAVFKLTFQFWAMAVDWPMNVGGKPWNSLPAYVPVTFEVMVLLAGLGVVFAFLLRCGLFPGKQAVPSLRGATDDRFVLVLENPANALDANVARHLFEDFHALAAEEREVQPAQPRPRRALNRFLFLAFLAALGLYVITGRDLSQRNFEFMPDMSHWVAYDTYAPNPDLPGGKTLQAPQPGTIPRGPLPLHYGPSAQDAARAGAEPNPFPAGAPGALKRGAFVYKNFCSMCHGTEGKGDGPVSRRGGPLAPSLLAVNALEMKDGQMFHVITYGQKTMAAHAALLSRDDRWKVILYVRLLQQQAAGVKRP